ncbi:MAG: NOL1/NOP2/sun family putative RNA methylase [Candidatus Heimdallarchaeota archaeon]
MPEEQKQLAERFGYLEETIERFVKLFGIEETKEMLRAYQKSPQPTIRVNTLKISPFELKKRLELKGFSLTQSQWYKEGFHVKFEPISLGATTEYLSGFYFIQSAASWLPALLLDPQPNQFIIDIAAAPGGKTTHIAQLMNNTGVLLCYDVSRDRMKSLRSNLNRCGVMNAICIRSDARKLRRLQLKADKILLDAPCTGEGLMAVDPSRKTSKNKEDILRLQKLQKVLIEIGISSLRKGGELVYSTCSTAPEENEDVIQGALDKFPIKIMEHEFKEFPPGLTKAFGKEYSPEMRNAIRLYPHKNNTEGFFVCKLMLEEEL